MEYVKRISYHLKDRSEVPNQELAKELALSNNKEGVSEIYSYLDDANKSIASDCLKVLYEVGYLAPELIVGYCEDFFKLLESKNNRMVWGSMIAIANIAKIDPSLVYAKKDLIIDKVETGSLITQVWGIYALVNMIAGNSYYFDEFKNYLFSVLAHTRAIDFTKRAITISEIVEEADKEEFKSILASGLDKVSKSARKKLEKLIRDL